MRRFGVRLVLGLALGVILSGCAFLRPQAPPLSNAYADLTAFWQQAAGSLGMEPEEVRLRNLKLGYDTDGEILYLNFQLYVERGAGEFDLYYYSQHADQKASWGRQRGKGSMRDFTVPAHEAFAALNQIGVRALEKHQQLTPPVRLWFSAETGSGTYKPLAGGYLAENGQLTPIGPEGVSFQGEHGVVGIAEGAIATTNSASTTASPTEPGPPMFLLPFSPRN